MTNLFCNAAPPKIDNHSQTFNKIQNFSTFILNLVLTNTKL